MTGELALKLAVQVCRQRQRCLQFTIQSPEESAAQKAALMDFRLGALEALKSMEADIEALMNKVKKVEEHHGSQTDH